jgi:fatty acid desaturase
MEFCCYPMFFTVASYRQNHLNHHQHLNPLEDPDWAVTIGRPGIGRLQSKQQFLLRIAMYFVGIQGIQDIIWIFGRLRKSSSQKKEWRGTVYTVLLFCLISFLGFWKIYLLYWVVPLLTAMLMFNIFEASRNNMVIWNMKTCLTQHEQSMPRF